jgi:hypothetical protein
MKPHQTKAVKGGWELSQPRANHKAAITDGLPLEEIVGEKSDHDGETSYQLACSKSRGRSSEGAVVSPSEAARPGAGIGPTAPRNKKIQLHSCDIDRTMSRGCQ